ncbi:MAG: oligoendopeptidase F [Mycoplasmatota bacterium]
MKWNLEQLYKNDLEWSKDLEVITKEIELVTNFKGKLNDKKTFLEYLDYSKSVDVKLEVLYCYAMLKFSTNQKDVSIQEQRNKVVNLFQHYNSLTSFVSSEIIAIGQDNVNAFIKETHNANKFNFDKLFRNQKYIKSADEELLMSHYQAALDNYDSLYDQLSVADATAVDVTLSTGEVLNVSTANFRSLLEVTKSQEDRKLIFEAVFKYFETHKNTFASIYLGIVQSRSAKAKVRGHESILDMVLYSNNIDKQIYLNLINTTKENTEPVKKYFDLRKKYFGIETHYTYDRPLQLKTSKTKFDYNTSLKLVLESIETIGGEFYEFALDVLKDGLVDVYPVDGKQSGAFSCGIAEHEPFILLNHTDTINDCFTLAHEAGHSMHTKFSQKYQPAETANYTLFVAEIASIFNEHLLLDHLLSKITDKNEKIVMLQSAIDGLLGTFYRQSLFADYEYQAHKYYEENGTFNHVVLSNIMKELNMQYYGLDLDKQQYKQYVWAYIPHFHSTAFYVYQYATSYAASIMMYENVKNNNGLNDYLTLLKSGGSDYPVELVKKANVDLTTKEPFEAVCNRLTKLVDELEKLLGEE